MVRHFVVEIESTEPSISKVQLNFLTKPSLKADAVAGAHNQHPQHELRIDRRSPNIVNAAATQPSGKTPDSFDPAKFPGLKEMDSIESGAGFVIGVARPSKPRSD